ncbi:hypothetical protein I4U23_012127 [Adineta vaga]|nr:hypothetical protein I4U23_012127 [Adineta vaga]
METLGRYDYINEEEIDELLKCIICMKPHMDPVWTNCTDENHIFCRLCIEKYIEKQKACPKCQQHLSKEDLTPNSDRSLTMLLNKLRVKCSHCNKEGLKRIDFDNHCRNMCLEAIVACLAADMNCSWNGPRRKLEKHLKKCRVYHLKDVITELRHENKHLKDQVNQQSNEIDQIKDKLREGQDQLQGLMDSFKQVKEQAHQQSIEMKQFTDTLSEQKTQFQECMNILKTQTQVIELLSERKENSQSGLAVNAHEQMILGRNLSNIEVRNPFLFHSQFQHKADDTKVEYELQQPNNETNIYANKDEQQLSVHGQKQFFNGISTVYDAFNSSGETYPSVPIIELPTRTFYS